MIYLDHNATTPVAPEVRKAMAPFLEGGFGNPSSGYFLGREAREALEQARSAVAEALGARPGEIFFTSGGTESDNLALFGAARSGKPGGKHLVTTAVEHPAVLNPALKLMEEGFDVSVVPVDGRGLADPDDIRRAIRPDTILVSVMHAQNETGGLMPLAEIGGITREAGVLFHSDAAQSAGKVPLDVDSMGLDLLTVAGHKIYAPKGVGALFVRKGVFLAPLFFGGGQEGGLRPGTENVPYAVGLARALTMAVETMEEEALRIAGLRDLLHRELGNAVPGLFLNGPEKERLPGSLNVSFPGVSGAELLARVPEVCASSGAACHGADESVSHVLSAMGLSGERARGAVRLSLGRYTTEEEVRRAAGLLVRAMSAPSPS